jgi:hypothetical protein
MTYTQHIQILDIEDLWILRYSRFRVFTFLFFMPKILGSSSGKNNKSYRIFHNEFNKLGLHFSVFFIFYMDFTKITKSHILFENQTSLRPLECFRVHKHTLNSQVSPWKQLGTRNWVPRDGRRRSGQNSGEDSPESGRGRVGEGLGPTGV